MPDPMADLLLLLAQQGVVALMLTVTLVILILMGKRFLDTQDKMVSDQRDERRELVALHREERDRWLKVLEEHTTISKDNYVAGMNHYEWEREHIGAIQTAVERQR